ncbi:glucose 1-dehydrogenase [Nostoc sp. CHAB 5715]|uniref:glucose 1-dehydrogenase n=1 Tax=Nostoc sp. CHAB 5715 TaxID=2780400 RepID=UPI001E2FC647|nr:glucose 1-dehydrogenase [Nostoc sp. CHAB 5715]MCC5620981.1 glucose 1-dehydrogenase [Nostoc sp. CHAB 5715]
MKLQNKVAVITGGSSGMGFATAKLFLAEGARVAITGRREDALHEAAQKLGYAEQLLTVSADASKVDDLDRLYQQVEERFGKLDILFANAGVGDSTGIEDVTEEKFDFIVNVNFKGVFFTVQRALSHFNDGGAIVLNASLTAYQGLPNLTVYAATKAAVSSLARSMSAVLLKRRIRVNSVSPGVIETAMLNEVVKDADLQESLRQQIPVQRFGNADEVAKAVLFLASDDASYIVGEDLLVDGGRIRLGLWQQ